MIRSELETEVQRLVEMEGWTNGPTPMNATNLVNDAWKTFSWDGELILSTQTFVAVSGQAEYAPTTPVVRVLDVAYNGVYLDPSNLEWERWKNNQWRATQGTPLHWVQTGTNTIALSPAPDGTQNILVRAYSEGAAMAAAGDQPGQVNAAIPAGQISGVPPVNLHMGIAMLAAHNHGKAYMQGQSSDRVRYYLEQYQVYVQRALGKEDEKE